MNTDDVRTAGSPQLTESPDVSRPAAGCACGLGDWDIGDVWSGDCRGGLAYWDDLNRCDCRLSDPYFDQNEGEAGAWVTPPVLVDRGCSCAAGAGD